MARRITDFKLPSGLAVPPEQMEELHRLAEVDGANKMSICDDSEGELRTSVERMKRNFGEEVFPWDSWAEFKEAMELVKEEFYHRTYMDKLYELGNNGIGCQHQVFVYTFHFGENNEDEDSSFYWSSATATGWLEEDIGWYYERFFEGDFIGARRWYRFAAYQPLDKKILQLSEDPTAKGKRFRKYFSLEKDKEGKLLEIELPNIEGKVELRSEHMGPLGGGAVMKDIFDSMSDLVPGLGRILEERVHSMLSESLIGGPED
ncbi:hypothetical protein V494_00850 [Pseudogymnoascus sp. VKM F-4513 (FW-928)]|nr:hypothetical protein V494_00850 [Pseudogymnoascus sp. VKM F-4513 (FW-928)]